MNNGIVAQLIEHSAYIRNVHSLNLCGPTKERDK